MNSIIIILTKMGVKKTKSDICRTIAPNSRATGALSTWNVSSSDSAVFVMDDFLGLQYMASIS